MQEIVDRESRSMKDLFGRIPSECDYESKRGKIKKVLFCTSPNVKDENIKKISTSDLELLFRMYDAVFFGNWFSGGYKGKFKFSFSRRMTKSAGMTLCPKTIGKLREEDVTIEIRMGVDFFLRYNETSGGKSVCGIRTGSSLDALMLVFEHELCHAVEFILYGKSSCKVKRFKEIARYIFGHTGSYHALPTHRQIAGINLGLKVGDRVSFNYEGGRYEGVIYAINKRATVFVKDKKGTFKDTRGARYSKYYIPPGLLQKSIV